ncbi:HNH endonuclease domain-containing protein [Yersinia pekkanenii]|uniref:HNH endonuclease domain-containing protein n=1 Tax=Yersinia pekkanenii TaxID=1288385 RepID=A0A0T9R3S7_9GAMM|nr:HNH endonuclease domain-containing protein [Yersinia pekkanenii]
MSLNLPGSYLYYLSKDNLAPEEYERIISPHDAWSRICREYEFDDGYNASRYLINMREGRTYHTQASSGGSREKEKLEKMVFSGEVVMLSDIYGPARLFYINGEGQLMSADPHAFRLTGAAKIIEAFNASVKCRNYQRTGGKPRSKHDRDAMVFYTFPAAFEDEIARGFNVKHFAKALAGAGMLTPPASGRGYQRKSPRIDGRQINVYVIQHMPESSQPDE